MKKFIKITLLLLFSLGLVVLGHSASAYLSLQPGSASYNIGDNFNVAALVNGQGQKICAVKGSLVFNNLSCQSISLQEGIIAQASPSCQKPDFVIGIPGCSTTSQTLFTATVSGDKEGPASIVFSNVEIFGAGTNVGGQPLAAVFTINPKPQLIAEPVPFQEPAPPPVSSEEQPPSTTEPKQAEEEIRGLISELENEIAQQEEVAATAETAGFLAALGNAIFSASGLWTVLVILGLIGVYMLYQEWRKGKGSKNKGGQPPAQQPPMFPG